MLFIATANGTSTIPAPLLDRMEVVRLAGYDLRDKLAIARDHLVPRALKEAGLDGDLDVEDRPRFTDAALEALEGARREAKGADGGEAASSLRHTLEGMEHALAAEGAVKTELRVWGPEDAKSLFLRVQDRVFVRGPMHVQRLRAELESEGHDFVSKCDAETAAVAIAVRGHRAAREGRAGGVVVPRLTMPSDVCVAERQTQINS